MCPCPAVAVGVGVWTPGNALDVDLQLKVEKKPSMASLGPCQLRARAGLCLMVQITR